MSNTTSQTPVDPNLGHVPYQPLVDPNLAAPPPLSSGLCDPGTLGEFIGKGIGFANLIGMLAMIYLGFSIWGHLFGDKKATTPLSKTILLLIVTIAIVVALNYVKAPLLRLLC